MWACARPPASPATNFFYPTVCTYIFMHMRLSIQLFPIAAHQVPHMPDKLQYTNNTNAMGRYGQKGIVSI